MRENDLNTTHAAKVKVVAELEKLRTHTANRTIESVELHSAARNDERPAKSAKVSRGSKNSVGVPSTAAYCALPAERNEFSSRCVALTD